MQPPAPREPAAWLTARLDQADALDIEHHGLLSNHITHDWVVMALTGATAADATWWDRTYRGLGPRPHPRHDGGPEPAAPPPDPNPVDDTTWPDFVNARHDHYPAVRAFTRDLVERAGPTDAIRTIVPRVANGLAGAALHPLIHTGWAIEAGHRGMLADGLAYLVTVHQPVGLDPDIEPWAPHDGRCDVIGPAIALVTDAVARSLPDQVHARSMEPAYTATGRGLFQQRIMTFSDHALGAGAALDATAPLPLPPVGQPLDDVLEQVVALVAAACLASRGEFFVVHGVTSLHATVMLLPHLEPADQRTALAHWWRAAMATLIAQGVPGLEAAGELLDAWHRTDAAAFATGSLTWDERHRRCRRSLDEHVPKAVFSFWRWAEHGFVAPHTAALCNAAADDLVRSHPSRDVHENLWFAWS